MKLINKFSKGIIAVVVCLLLATTVWAADQVLVSYEATLDDAVLCVNELTEAKTVTLTVKAGETVEMDAFTAQVKAPQNLKIAGIANGNLSDGGFNFNLANGMILWYSVSAENVKNDLLATVTVEVPANTPAGEYVIEFQIIDISRDWGMPWENGKTLTATLTVVDHADGSDADHLCDTCNGGVEGAVCTYVPGEYIWSADNSSCTVVGTCACGETATAVAEVSANVTTTGTCQTAEIVTYTADFAEDWAKDQTKLVTGEKNLDNHAGEQTTTYTVDGENHIVTVSCACGAVISTETVEHDFTNGNCVCGAEKPEEPTDPEPTDPVTGLKGDVNLDGQVTLTDAVLAAQYYMDWDTNPITDPEVLYNADFNSDGVVSLTDAVEIAKYYMNN